MKENAGRLALFVLAGLAVATTQTARAVTINATLNATYFQVQSGSDPDFGVYSMPTIAANSRLGPNGLPVGSGVHDINAATGEITWWSPALNSHVVQTGTAAISLPYTSNMFAPNSTGSNDSAYFETAIFSGSFHLNNSSTVGFILGSDDDSFIYVDGALVGGNPGVRAVTTANFTSSMLAAGDHTVTVFYDDRQHVDAYLSLTLDANSSQVVVTPSNVPEPASILVLGGGILALVVAQRRRH